MIRVLLVGKTCLVRGALAALLSREEDIDVVAESEGDGELVARAMLCRPDVAVIDVDCLEGERLAARGELKERLAGLPDVADDVLAHPRPPPPHAGCARRRCHQYECPGGPFGARGTEAGEVSP